MKNNTQILLVAVNGSYTHTNLAIRCLRRTLEKASFSVQLAEYTLRDRNQHILDDIVSRNAEIIGFSVYIWNVQTILALASDIKKISPKTKIIFGGPEVSYDTGRFDGCSFIDAIVCGEGENALPGLCCKIVNGESYDRVIQSEPALDIMQDEGILYRKDEFDAGKIPVNALLYYESSRGCPYSCSYCLSSAECGVKYKSVEQTLRDLLEFEKLGDGYKIIKFVDRTFNFNAKRANAIWEALLDEKFTKHYHFEICASLLNEESFEILSRFPKGKIQLECGLQSTNEQTLNEVSRHINAENILQAVRRGHDMGNIHIHLDLIAGLPYEGYERFAQSFDEAYYCCDLLQLGFLKLLHGTALRNNADKYGIIYSDTPPYTVLRTNWMSYSDLSHLHAIAETLERYRESGKFNSSLVYAMSALSSPFRFYEGLTDYISENDSRHIQKLSQSDAYRMLYRYVKDNYAEEIDTGKFIGCLSDDFSENEMRRMPQSIFE